MLEVLIHRRRPGTICLLHVLYLRPTTWKRDTWHRPLAQATGPSAGRPGRSASGPHRCRAAHSQRDHARRPHAVPRILNRPAQPALLGRSILARAPDSLTTLLCPLLRSFFSYSKEQRSVVSAGTLDERLRGCWFCPVLVAVPPGSISFVGPSRVCWKQRGHGGRCRAQPQPPPGTIALPPHVARRPCGPPHASPTSAADSNDLHDRVWSGSGVWWCGRLAAVGSWLWSRAVPTGRACGGPFGPVPAWRRTELDEESAGPDAGTREGCGPPSALTARPVPRPARNQSSRLGP